MAIDREIQDVIQKHVENAVSEVAELLKARVAGVIGIGSGRGRGQGRRGPGRPPAGSAPRVVRQPGGGRTCIAANCKNPSKGPRFHFLCETHRKAPKAQVAKWQQAAAKVKKKKKAKAGA